MSAKPPLTLEQQKHLNEYRPPDLGVGQPVLFFAVWSQAPRNGGSPKRKAARLGYVLEVHNRSIDIHLPDSGETMLNVCYADDPQLEHDPYGTYRPNGAYVLPQGAEGQVAALRTVVDELEALCRKNAMRLDTLEQNFGVFTKPSIEQCQKDLLQADKEIRRLQVAAGSRLKPITNTKGVKNESVQSADEALAGSSQES